VRQDFPDRRVRRGQKVIPANPERQDRKVCRAFRGFRVRTAYRVSKEIPEQKATKDCPVHPERPESKVYKDRRAFKASPVQPELSVQPDRPANAAKPERQDRREQPANEDRKAFRVRRVRWALLTARMIRLTTFSPPTPPAHRATPTISTPTSIFGT
jgi:hypothetical protein